MVCCEDPQNSPLHCFQYNSFNNGKVCMPARAVVSTSRSCEGDSRSEGDCTRPSLHAGLYNSLVADKMDCPDVKEEEVCLVPVTLANTQLFKISVENSSFILFEGSALHLWFSGPFFFFFLFQMLKIRSACTEHFAVQIAEFSPRRWWLPFFSLPKLITQFLNYLASLSLALGVLNLAPVYFLDGEWACWAFISLLLPGTLSCHVLPRIISLLE